MANDVGKLRKAIEDDRLEWSAGATSKSRLPPEERKKLHGVKDEEGELERMEAAHADEDAYYANEGFLFPYPSKWDWRNVNSKDWTTSIKDQKSCGSCVSFGAIGAIESTLEIFRKNAYLEPDLSEADLFFCGCGKCCDEGWTVPAALNYARDTGIPDNSCFPYTPNDQPCKPCADKRRRVVKIKEWMTISTDSLAKFVLSQRGPLVATMKVYDDFYNYRGGIYKRSPTAKDTGFGHAFTIVGYDEDKRCWICKNSWGRSWGENGWFRIAYGQCGMGSSRAYYSVAFPTEDDDIIMPKTGKVKVKFVSKNAANVNDFWITRPVSKKIFHGIDSEVGKLYDVGSFAAGTRLIFSLKGPEGVFHTHHSMNDDACDHVRMFKMPFVNIWQLSWEDLYGLGDRDYNDIVVQVMIE